MQSQDGEVIEYLPYQSIWFLQKSIFKCQIHCCEPNLIIIHTNVKAAHRLLTILKDNKAKLVCCPRHSTGLTGYENPLVLSRYYHGAVQR